MLLRLSLIAAAATAALSGSALASSPDAWADFRTEVRGACLAAARAQGMRNPEVVTHPFGSPSYGIAVLREGDDKRICVFNKATKAVELT
ncbi:hypothetical protein [Phenylobacterium sp.]|uniref:hypothetical protein n=1 Tax=Phenylobacterium sp. TaxID=1871053 RepID=UPI0027304DDD|nr:hypothetical protein [Phenylobacterium sp.]MDP1875106.1 hypothetical protein [Phenylobacterium sp.]MDP3298795.1 hypothetical protein [Phenylobacterium sp.]